MRGLIEKDQGGRLLIMGIEGSHPIVEQSPRYALAEIGAGGRVIFCKLCRMVSASPDDVAERYCGHCHEFLADVDRAPRTAL